MRILLPLFALFIIAFVSCNQSVTNKNISKEEYSRPKGSYERNILGIVSLETYDHYTRPLKKGYGFYIDSKTIVAPLSLVKGSYKVKEAAIGTDSYKDIAGYTAYSIEKNLVLLKAFRENLNYLDLNKAIKEIPDSIESLYRSDKKLYAPKFAVGNKLNSDSLLFYPLKGNGSDGLPGFTFMHHVVGMIQNVGEQEDSTILVPASEILKLVDRRSKTTTSVFELRGKTNKIYPSYKSIEGFRMITTMGAIELKLFNETPVFRDNFIKLVSDQFYDSLLVHRVLRHFLIQTGAADSKYADKDDIVGWQGPGYMLKTDIDPSKFHKRGAVAMSKLPDSRNPNNLTDGSQFYIVSGRTFSYDELNDIEKEKKRKFTAEQRKIYTTIGGAPHLDGDYVVFGDVTKGMDVVDKIAAVKTYAEDRPIDDIRVIRIEMIRK